MGDLVGGLWVTRGRCTLKRDFYLFCSGRISLLVWISVSYDLNTNCSHNSHMGHLLPAGNTVLEVVETLRGEYLERKIVGYCPCRLKLIHSLFMSVLWFLSMMRRRISPVIHSYYHKDLPKVVGMSSHELNLWKLRKNEVFLFFRCSPKCCGHNQAKTTCQLQYHTISPSSTNSCNFNTIWGDFTEKGAPASCLLTPNSAN